MDEANHRRSTSTVLARGESDRQFVTALARGLEVLRCFTQERQRLGSKEIANLTGLPQPTVWRLCYTLQTLGYLTPTQHGDKLMPAVPLLALGFAALASLDFVQIVRPHMQAVADRFHAAVALSQRDRMSMVYLERCHGESVYLLNLRPGTRLPIFNSAAGWAYLAALDAADRDVIMTEIQERSAAHWPHVKAKIEHALDDYARLGFIANYLPQHHEINAVAVPIRHHDRVISLSCSLPRFGVDRDLMEGQIGPELIDTSRIVADALASQME